MYIVGMNGPPRAGKDTIANLLATHIGDKHDLPVMVVSLSKTMAVMAAAFHGVPVSNEWYEAEKDRVQELTGVTLREFIIRLSEEHMKPLYGEAIWTKVMLNYLTLTLGVTPATHGVAIVTNFGFQYEPQMFCDTFGVNNVVTARVHRPDENGVIRTFAGDSRGWVTSPLDTDLYVGEGEAKTEAIRLYGRLVNHFGWVF